MIIAFPTEITPRKKKELIDSFTRSTQHIYPTICLVHLSSVSAQFWCHKQRSGSGQSQQMISEASLEKENDK